MEASFGLATATQPGLQSIGSAIAADAYAVTVNFEVNNFLNSDIISFKGVDLIHGAMEHSPLDIAPGQSMKFAARKAQASFYGSKGVALFEIATRLLLVYWQVPLTGLGGYNELGIGISKPGQVKADLYGDASEVDNNGGTEKKLVSWSFHRMDHHGKIVEIADEEFAVRGTMDTNKRTTIKLDIVHIDSKKFPPTLKDYLKKTMDASFALIPAAQPGLQWIGSAIAADKHSATVNFEFANYCNSPITYKGVYVIHGAMEHSPLDIAPGQGLSFAARTQEEYAWRGSMGYVLFEIETRLVLVYWQVPNSGFAGYNALGVGFTKPGQASNSEVLNLVNTNVWTNYKKNFPHWICNDIKTDGQVVEIADAGFAMRGSMGYYSHTKIKLAIVPIGP